MNGKLAESILIIVMPLLCIAFCLLLRRAVSGILRTGRMEYDTASGKLPPSIIRHSIDNLPMGMVFYRRDGHVMLKNHVMDALSEAFTGHELMNGKQFLTELLSGSSMRRPADIRGTEDSFLLIEEEGVLSFRRELLFVNGRELFQLIAYDTTGFYETETELKDCLTELKEAGARIAEDADKAALLAKGEELLSTKARIHDMVGQVLLSARYCLTENEQRITDSEVLRQMVNAMDDLLTSGKTQGKPSQADAVKKSLTDAAEAMGLALRFQGDILAVSARLMRMLTAGARVCMTNAVRHGMAKHMVIDMETGTAYSRIRFSNDGHAPEEGFAEGGGLGALRRQAEQAGGSLDYGTDPAMLPEGCCFAVTIAFPWGSGSGRE